MLKAECTNYFIVQLIFEQLHRKSKGLNHQKPLIKCSKLNRITQLIRILNII